MSLVAGGVGLVAGIAALVQFFASLLYVRRLAPRLPSPAIAERAKTYMWLLPLIFIGGSCIVIGPIVALVMYLVLLNDVRLLVEHARREQDRLPA